MTCADTGTEKVPDFPSICTIPPLTNGVLKTAPDREICVVSVVNENVNAEFENGTGFVAPVGVTLPDPMPWNVNVIVIFTPSHEIKTIELGFQFSQ
ncbi:MAG TPA: hypothetical protein VMA31_02795 [Bryobacteraceae bacterium]|nr:hypothetical protein [Bryobacteraceae bacterium]